MCSHFDLLCFWSYEIECKNKFLFRDININDFYDIFQAKIQSLNNEKCSIAISLDQLRDADILPLTNLLMSIDSADIDAVDIFLESNSDLGKENVKALINAVNLKLRVVDLQDLALGNDFLWSVSNSNAYSWEQFIFWLFFTFISGEV